jgi:hypothetical protein
VDFLGEAQLAHGEFSTQVSKDPGMGESEYASSAFGTALILHCLRSVEGPEVQALTSKALQFLETEVEHGGLWRFWSSRSPMHRMVPCDLDSTCCASFALRLYGRAMPENRGIVLGNRAADGRFYTWLRPDLADAATFLLWSLWSGQSDDIDPVVNANAVLYLGESAETAAALQYLSDVVETSRYYEDPLAVYYMLARAAAFSAPSLLSCGGALVSRVLSRSREALSPLQDALSLATLLRCEVDVSPALACFVDRLIRTQATDGSWPAAALFRDPARFYGSRELTTALCLEALATYASEPLSRAPWRSSPRSR